MTLISLTISLARSFPVSVVSLMLYPAATTKVRVVSAMLL